MYKSPKYKPIQINSVKDRQKYLKNLNEQVNKSKMAVQTIASFRTSQMNFKKKIDEIQQQLHGCVSRINIQSKKNVVLKQLITLMKGEMFNFQKTQKRQQQKNQQQAQKKIKKVQYDIEQILQKHNQQIAKITSLKQLANSGRSQRVVFSNLFKKLQKQIKQNEQLYKQNLMKSQVAKDKQSNIKSPTRMLQRQSQDQQQPANKLSQTNIDILPDQIQFISSSSNPNNQNAFLTAPVDTKRQHRSVIVKQQYSSTNQSNGQQNQSESKVSMRKFNDLICRYENFLQKIKIFIGCQQFDKTINFYQTIDKNNQNLVSHINCYNDQILRFQTQINDINTQKKHLECIQKVRELPVGSTRRIKTKQSLSGPRHPSQSNQNAQIILQVGKLLKLPINQDDQLNDDDLKLLDMNLDYLIEQFKDEDQIKNSNVSQVNRATTATSQANAVDILLDRMERFSQCEKLLDKNLFKQEYIKEITKNKKHRNKK